MAVTLLVAAIGHLRALAETSIRTTANQEPKADPFL